MDTDTAGTSVPGTDRPGPERSWRAAVVSFHDRPGYHHDCPGKAGPIAWPGQSPRGAREQASLSPIACTST